MINFGMCQAVLHARNSYALVPTGCSNGRIVSTSPFTLNQHAASPATIFWWLFITSVCSEKAARLLAECAFITHEDPQGRTLQAGEE
jgi:hypothetical protein